VPNRPMSIAALPSMRVASAGFDARRLTKRSLVERGLDFFLALGNVHQAGLHDVGHGVGFWPHVVDRLVEIARVDVLLQPADEPVLVDGGSSEEHDQALHGDGQTDHEHSRDQVHGPAALVPGLGNAPKKLCSPSPLASAAKMLSIPSVIVVMPPKNLYSFRIRNPEKRANLRPAGKGVKATDVNASKSTSPRVRLSFPTRPLHGSRPLMARKRIGELLLERGAISKEQLEAGLEGQKRTRQRLGVTLIQQGVLTEIQLAQVLAQSLSLATVDLNQVQVDGRGAHAPQPLLRATSCSLRHRGKGTQHKKLLVAMSDPLNLPATEEIESPRGCR